MPPGVPPSDEVTGKYRHSAIVATLRKVRRIFRLPGWRLRSNSEVFHRVGWLSDPVHQSIISGFPASGLPSCDENCEADEFTPAKDGPRQTTPGKQVTRFSAPMPLSSLASRASRRSSPYGFESKNPGLDPDSRLI